MNSIERTRPGNPGQRLRRWCVCSERPVWRHYSSALDLRLHKQLRTRVPTGIWKVVAQDKRVATLELLNYNGRLTGTLTNAHATTDGNGKLVAFDAIPGAAPIVQASISQGMLVMNAESINEALVPWNMTLIGEGKGLLQLAFKGHEMTFQITRIEDVELDEVPRKRISVTCPTVTSWHTPHCGRSRQKS